MSTWFDRQGKAITAERYQELCQTPGCVRDLEVSTVWLGIDHRFHGDGGPLIFETMVFAGTRQRHLAREEHYQERYCTEGEARAGHARTVSDLRAGRALGER